VNGCRPTPLARWALLLALGWALLLGQQAALVHPLEHLGEHAAVRGPAHRDAQAPDVADAGCALCLGCAGAAHLAAAAPIAAAAHPSKTATQAVCATPATPVAAAARWRNRGPPATA
jgi:cobalamin biosynthesis protein CobD/CbiB